MTFRNPMLRAQTTLLYSPRMQASSFYINISAGKLIWSLKINAWDHCCDLQPLTLRRRDVGEKRSCSMAHCSEVEDIALSDQSLQLAGHIG